MTPITAKAKRASQTPMTNHQISSHRQASIRCLSHREIMTIKFTDAMSTAIE
jgi:hypothetical protein